MLAFGLVAEMVCMEFFDVGIFFLAVKMQTIIVFVMLLFINEIVYKPSH